MWEIFVSGGDSIDGGGASEVGKVELDLEIHCRNDRCSKKGYTSPLNSHPNFKNQAGWPSRGG